MNDNNSRQQGLLDKNRAFLTDIQSLYATRRDAIYSLRRNIGKTLETCQQSELAWFHGYLRRHYGSICTKADNQCFLVAGLMTLDDATLKHGIEKTAVENFGATLALLRPKSKRQELYLDKQDGLSRRFNLLFGSEFDENGDGATAYLLRQSVRYALSELQFPNAHYVDWPQLLYDMHKWDSDIKFVQKKWASSFYVLPACKQDEASV